jgi:cytochrome c oxidase assembly protein subunit 15
MEGKLFRRLGLWTIGAVYFLILIGGIVRATGSGMGCPDWPKCFGSWVPPTDVSQLPSNYQEIFGAKLKGEIEFNVFKTWTEYVNRLVGVLIGFFIFATFVVSFFTFWKKDRTIVWLSLVAFLLVGFEGWLGAKVVSTELHPLMVTLHMLLSIIIVFILLYAIARSFNEIIEIENIREISSISFILTAIMILSLGQVLLGTQVREMVDEVALKFGDNYRSLWVENLGGKFQTHRIFSFVILALHLFLFVKIYNNIKKKGVVFQMMYWLIIFIFIEMFSGFALSYFNIPPFAQPIHLTISTLALGIQFVMILLLNKDRVFRMNQI